jgi:hypothetical protein
MLEDLSDAIQGLEIFFKKIKIVVANRIFS